MTNEQIRARIVGALSASAMNAQENAECIRYLDQIQTLEEAVVQLRKQWQEAETLICMMCEHCEWEDHDGLLCMTTDCGEINGYPCCGKFAHRMRMKQVEEGLPRMHEETFEGMGDNGEDVACLVSDPVLGFTNEGRYVVVRTGPVEWQRDNLWWDEEGTSHKVTHWMELPGALVKREDQE